MVNTSIVQITSAALLLLALAILPSPTHAWEKRTDPHGKTIIAYYASWQWYDRNGLAKPTNLDHTKVTRYNFAFFQINSAGDIWGTDSWADPITLYGEFDWSGAGGVTYCSWDHEEDPPVCAGHHYDTGLISQAHKAGVEVYPSIGGWTLSDPFPALAASADARLAFANNCVKLIEEYDFDGIDIDWEYPGYSDHSGTPEDTVNYSLFLQDIRDALDGLGERTGRFYGLTAALPCGPDLINNIQIDTVSDILTELNLMTYDFHGSWNRETGANAPLYDMEGSPEFSVHGCVENWMEGGGRPDQINIGMPFYGRSFAGEGLTGFGQVHSGYADVATWSDDEGSPQYFNIVAKLSAFTTVRDPESMTEFAYKSSGFVSYDDERAICDKTEYAMEHDLNGYIIWEISGDILPDLSTPLLDAMNDRLNNPSVPCDPDAPLVEMDMIAEDVWYPSQALGYCVNDGKEQENFIAPDYMFSSAEACCVYSFSNDSCTSLSVEEAEEKLWYPDPSLGYCVNDGNQDQLWSKFVSILYISVNFYQRLRSAEACCDGVYSFSSTCLSSSLDPGSGSDRWVHGISEGNPWYPKPTISACVNDGNHEQNDVDVAALGHMFTSAEACCDEIYWFNTDCLLVSTNPIDPVIEGKWYPNDGHCTSESPVPSWAINVFDSEEECCDQHFGLHYYDCVQDHVTEESVARQPTPRPTKKPTTPRPTKKPTPNNTGNIEFNSKYAFYPHFGEDGASVECRNDGNAPAWIDISMMRNGHYECCSSFVFPSWSDECNSDHPFYPNFSEYSCVNDGNHPDWMAGDYLVDSMWVCCHNFFQHDEELLEQCTSRIPAFGCDNCDGLY
ncbi:hypothetical protein ACHAXR_011209 [Thalassiosira sp. AJA248-18]